LKKYRNQDFMATHKAINQNQYARFVNVWENDRHVIVNYYIDRDGEYDIYLALYGKDTGHTPVLKNSPENPYAELFVHPYCVQGNRFTGLIAADKLLEIASKIKGSDAVPEKVKKCAEQIAETDNPVLVRFTFKPV
jgi:hypothetical protein